MKEYPILFSGEMVRALLDGSKTQTRRIVKPQPISDHHFVGGYKMPILKRYFTERQTIGEHSVEHPCIYQCGPYGQPGERLWVRETHAIVPRTAYAHSDGVQQMLRPDDDHDAAIFREGWTRSRGGFRWRPSIHMPRWASRITLEITGVRVERLQDCSEADARAEGVSELPLQAAERGAWWTADPSAGAALHGRTPIAGYRLLWEQINGPASWDDNPWVWVVEFKRVTP